LKQKRKPKIFKRVGENTKKIKIMKKILIFSLVVASVILMSATTPKAVDEAKTINSSTLSEEVKLFMKENPNFTIKDFLTLTPKKYKELTGKKLGFKKAMMLKVAQKKLKKSIAKPDKTNGISKGVYILLLLIPGFTWLSVGLASNWEGNDWWVNLLLWLLCWLPGFIHALVKMKNYQFN